ncbi:hypothetical protein BC936DRAFT_145591 [Jimgerdemannia flammicorona]|uniref:Uncharacterized protein n=1 Tax=Jimgerdemannia flammicorona TaxID=994334 RepID=A0A433D9M7_9FUNG|nr:hypothetical protein BC936DRAFT_145591 [Jimgerdemannia flammicorona]
MGPPPFLHPVTPADNAILVTEFLMHYFLKYRSYDAFTDLLDLDGYLKPLFARTMIASRIGDAADWYPLLASDAGAKIQTLSTDMELSFAPQTARASLRFLPQDPDYGSNIRTLTTREFRIDTQAYYRHARAEFDDAIDLDGLTPAKERVVEYRNRPGVERHEEEFEFGEVVGAATDALVKVEGEGYQSLTGRGVWVVDFVGGRQSCRAVIRKVLFGIWRRLGPLFDDPEHQRGHITNACWIHGVAAFLLKNETYKFGAGFYVNPEAVVKDHTAQYSSGHCSPLFDHQQPTCPNRDPGASIVAARNRGYRCEPRPNIAVPLPLMQKTHRRHCSDINGIIRLGSLEGIASISTPQTSWKIDGDDEGSTDTPSVVQEYANTDIRISLSGQDC